AIVVEIDERDRGPRGKHVPACVVGPGRARDGIALEATARAAPTAHPCIGTGAEVRVAVAIDVTEPQRAVVRGPAPPGVVRERGPSEDLAEPIAGRRGAPNPRRSADADVISAVAGHIGEPECEVELLGVETSLIGPR